jgi:hypothetical protein
MFMITTLENQENPEPGRGFRLSNEREKRDEEE